MSEELIKFIRNETSDAIFIDNRQKTEFLERVQQGNFAEKENWENHLIVYFTAFNTSDRTVYLVYDLKTDLWLFPGGHVRSGENPRDSLVREVAEELGFNLAITRISKPFLVTKTRSTQVKRGCVWHWDIWYKVDTNGQEFNISKDEFKKTKWLTLKEAKKIVVEPNTLAALERIYG